MGLADVGPFDGVMGFSQVGEFDRFSVSGGLRY